MITAIAFTAYPARDVAALRRFYTGVLGLTFSDPYCEDGTEKYAEAQIGSGCFSLMTSDWMEVAPGSCAAVAFEVDDIERSFADLGKHGIPTPEIHETPVCKLGSFRDPEGNKITLHQLTAPAR